MTTIIAAVILAAAVLAHAIAQGNSIDRIANELKQQREMDDE